MDKLDALIQKYKENLRAALTGKLEIRGDKFNVFTLLVEMMIRDLEELREDKGEG